MSVPDLIIIAPDYTVCEYCGESYADTAENMHSVLIEKDGARRIHTACVHCIARAKEDPDYDEYMTNKAFNEQLGRRINCKKN